MNQFSLIQSTDKDEYYLLLDDTPLATLLPIPRGSFLREDDCTITVDAFYMMQLPVTQELYKAVTGVNPAHFKGKNNPVEQVMWYDMVDFCVALNKALGIVPGFYSIDKYLNDKKNQNKGDNLKWKVNYNEKGSGFRLPTEAEWEYAAKGSINVIKRFEYVGSQILDHVGWYKKNNEYETKPAGLKFPNAFGLYDMSGNVWEWCWDWHGEFDQKIVVNPTGPKSGTHRVHRGGSWISIAAFSRTAFSYDWHPGHCNNYLGFRLVFVL